MLDATELLIKHGLMSQATHSSARSIGFEKACYPASLCLHFFICKMEKINVPTFWGCYGVNEVIFMKHMKRCRAHSKLCISVQQISMVAEFHEFWVYACLAMYHLFHSANIFLPVLKGKCALLLSKQFASRHFSWHVLIGNQAFIYYPLIKCCLTSCI